ncbi:MAG: hypothetical protein AAB974_04455 [Patescibacteria group bacterium]
MSNRTLSLAVVALLVLGVLTSAAVVIQNQQLLILTDRITALSDQAERTFDVVQKRAMGEQGTQLTGRQSEPLVMHALYVESDLGVAIAVPTGAPGLIDITEETTSVGSDQRLPTAVLHVRGADNCEALVFVGDKNYQGNGSAFDPDKALIEDPDRFHVYGPENLCGASIVVLPRAE